MRVTLVLKLFVPLLPTAYHTPLPPREGPSVIAANLLLLQQLYKKHIELPLAIDSVKAIWQASGR